MTPLSSTLFRVAALAVALPILGMSASIEINGTCYSASCPGTALTMGQSVSGSYNMPITVNGDTFQFSGAYAGSFPSGTSITADPSVTYTGAGLSKSDTITVDFYQTYYDSAATTYSGNYTETIPLIVAPKTTVSADLLVDGLGIGVVNGNGPGSYEFTKTTDMSAPGSTLTYDYQFVFTFDGASTGTTSSSTPEPAQMIPAAMSLIGFALVALRRRKQ